MVVLITKIHTKLDLDQVMVNKIHTKGPEVEAPIWAKISNFSQLERNFTMTKNIDKK
jgi:hypothetical protein